MELEYLRMEDQKPVPGLSGFCYEGRARIETKNVFKTFVKSGGVVSKLV